MYISHKNTGNNNKKGLGYFRLYFLVVQKTYWERPLQTVSKLLEFYCNYDFTNLHQLKQLIRLRWLQTASSQRAF